MLARSSVLNHPSGMNLGTPLLVPSFSSRGYDFTRDGESEVAQALRTSAEYLTESMLFSAYDIHHGHIPKGYESLTDLVFVDSGGYETGIDHDLSAVNRHPDCLKAWNEDALREVLDEWPDECPAVFVSYDHLSERMCVADQIARAKTLFARYPNHLHDILLKPCTRDQRYVPMDEIVNNIHALAGFDIIGLTEKELGNSMLIRMKHVAEFRRELDNAGIRAPLHVFGSLDPLSSCLYFVAGAEIFDGLTWLRYSYLNGTAVYPFNYAALRIGIHKRDDFVRGRSLADNITSLEELELRMRGFARTGDFTSFDYHSDLIKKAYESLNDSLGGDI